MDRKHLQKTLEGIRHLLSHLHGDVSLLESQYAEVLLLLRRLEKTVDVDDLTGLMRRNSFFSKWQAVLDECKSLNEECGMMMIDIDHFKSVNDTHGHPTGDEVIKNVADLLKQFESPDCLSGRYGGEEFIVGVKGSREKVEQIAEEIRAEAEQLSGPVIDTHGKPSNHRSWNCTVSIGTVSMPAKQSVDLPRLLKTADEALYEAKNAGRNRVKSKRVA